jgi:hypothetical protein
MPVSSRVIPSLAASVVIGLAASVAVPMAVARPALAGEVWAVHEVKLRASRGHANPYVDVKLSARFEGPSGPLVVPGYWDGGDVFKIRFTPPAEGRWTYRTTSSDPGLDGKTGALVATRASKGRHGFVRRDPAHPYHWVRDDGTRFFMMGQTYYDVIATALVNDRWKPAVDASRAHGMDKIRLRVFVKTCGNEDNPHPCSSPYAEGGRDKDRLNLPHFRALDEIVAYLDAKGMVADLLVFNSGNEYYGTQEQDARFARYVLARYAAYPNVIWCVTNEYQVVTRRSKDDFNALGRLLRDEDPWMKRGQALRGLSIHPYGGKRQGDVFHFFDEGWPVHAILQTGRHDPGDPKLYETMLENRGFDMPVVNDEFGYMGDFLWRNAAKPRPPGVRGSSPEGRRYSGYSAEKHRHSLWAIYMAGGQAATGDKNLYADGRPYKSGTWHDLPEYDDVRHLVDFFTRGGIEYWKLAPQPIVGAGERVYLLAEPGRQYVAYAAIGGPIELPLPPGRYRATRFDPRTGARAPLGEVTGGEARVRLELPPGQDWAVSLTLAAGRTGPTGRAR